MAQPIRHLLRYANIDFVDELYECGDAPEYDRSCWGDVKKENKMGLAFPNLPYILDPNNGVALTQSGTCLKYVARKANLMGATAEDQAHVDMLADTLVDFRGMVVSTAYAADMKDRMPKFREVAKERLAGFSSYLGKNDWFVGNAISYADFMIYEMVLEASLMIDKAFPAEAPFLKGTFPNLHDYVERFEDLPAIKKFMAEKDYSLPFNNKMASFK